MRILRGIATITMGLAICTVGSATFMALIAFAVVLVYFLAFGLLYVVGGDAGLELIRGFLEPRRK